MAAGTLKVVLIVCSDRAMREALRLVVEEAGCQSVMAPTVPDAQLLLARATPILVLVDPACSREASDALGGSCRMVEFPVRVSSTGVRRIAKHSDVGVKWLTALVESSCEAATEP